MLKLKGKFYICTALVPLLPIVYILDLMHDT